MFGSHRNQRMKNKASIFLICLSTFLASCAHIGYKSGSVVAKVIEWDDKKNVATISAGRQDGIQPYMRFVIKCPEFIVSMDDHAIVREVRDASCIVTCPSTQHRAPQVGDTAVLIAEEYVAPRRSINFDVTRELDPRDRERCEQLGIKGVNWRLAERKTIGTNSLMCVQGEAVPFTGRFFGYDENDGSKFSEMNYKEGRQHGADVFFHDNGRESSETLYLADKKHGKSTCWYYSGKKQEETHYVNDEERGSYTRWHENGRKAVEGVRLSPFEKDGRWTTWYENGQKQTEITYVQGLENGVSRGWYENGHQAWEGSFSKGLKEGLWTNWTDRDKKAIQYAYKGGVRSDHASMLTNIVRITLFRGSQQTRTINEPKDIRRIVESIDLSPTRACACIWQCAVELETTFGIYFSAQFLCLQRHCIPR